MPSGKIVKIVKSQWDNIWAALTFFPRTIIKNIATKIKLVKNGSHQLWQETIWQKIVLTWIVIGHVIMEVLMKFLSLVKAII